MRSALAEQSIAPPARWAASFPGKSVDEYRRGMLDALFQCLNHCCGVMAVYEAVIERGGQVHHAPDGDCAVVHHRALDCAIDAENRDLGRIDDGRRGDSTQLAQARHRDCRSRQLITSTLV